MTTLLTAVGTLIALAALVAQFYFKWVPNSEDQKRHIKRASQWALDIFTFGSPAVCMYIVAQLKVPVTPRFVVGVGVLTCVTTINAILILLRRLFGSLTKVLVGTHEHLKWQSDGTLEHAAITRDIIDSLCMIANDPNLSPETKRSLHAAIYGSATAKTLDSDSRSGS